MSAGTVGWGEQAAPALPRPGILGCETQIPEPAPELKGLLRPAGQPLLLKPFPPLCVHPHRSLAWSISSLGKIPLSLQELAFRAPPPPGGSPSLSGLGMEPPSTQPRPVLSYYTTFHIPLKQSGSSVLR